MTVVEYMLAIIAIVLGLAIGKVLDKFSTTIKGSNWTDFNWFLSVWCLHPCYTSWVISGDSGGSTDC